MRWEGGPDSPVRECDMSMRSVWEREVVKDGVVPGRRAYCHPFVNERGEMSFYMGTEGGVGGGALGSISLPLSIETPKPNLAAPWRWSISPANVKPNAGESLVS